MLCVSSDRPVDPLTLAVMREVDSQAKELNVPYFLTGAMARDIVLTGVFGIDTGRATRDVDFAVAVESWQHFDAIKTRLVTRGTFEAAPKVAQRLYFKLHAAQSGYPLDLIPFRGVEGPTNSIAWPPDNAVVMNVMGYEEALATAQLVEVAPGFLVTIVSLSGLALLKLFAWSDRGADNPKDALDLVTLFHNYARAGNQDRLYGDAISLLEAADYDLDRAAVQLLGRDVRAMAAPGTRVKIASLLNDATKMDRLARDMTKGIISADDRFEEARRLLRDFCDGVMQRSAKGGIES